MYRFSLSLASIFLAGIGIALLLGRLPIAMVGSYLVFSLLTFFMYWKDKKAAKEDAQRVPENTLHILAILGGWPGALYGQQMLRHKSQKVSFRAVLWLTVIINLLLLTSLLYSTGSLSFLS